MFYDCCIVTAKSGYVYIYIQLYTYDNNKVYYDIFAIITVYRLVYAHICKDMLSAILSYFIKCVCVCASV